MATFPTISSAPVVRPCLVVRRRRNRGQRNPAPKKPLPRRGTDRVFATVAFDVGRKPRKGGRARYYGANATSALAERTIFWRDEAETAHLCREVLSSLSCGDRTGGSYFGG